MSGLKSLAAATAAVTIAGGALLGGIISTSSSSAPARPTAAAPSTTSSSTSAPGTEAVETEPGRGSVSDPGSTQPAGTATGGGDRLVGADTPAPGDAVVDPIGQVDLSGRVPAGLDLTTVPDEVPSLSHPVPSGSGGGSLSAGPWCLYQCIESGIAYPRGFGVELVVETKVPADIFMTVITDDDGDGTTELVDVDYSPYGVTHHAWALDHLDPGQTYYVMVTATDEHDDTSYAWGQFTTLSTRTIEVSVSEVDIAGGPGNVVTTSTYLRLDDDAHQAYELGTWADLGSVGRTADLDLLVMRWWDGEVCESIGPDGITTPQGDSDDACTAWNTASADELDLDVLHPSKSRWSSVSFTRELSTPAGGPSLPAGYGDPRWFHVNAVATIHVTYSA